MCSLYHSPLRVYNLENFNTARNDCQTLLLCGKLTAIWSLT